MIRGKRADGYHLLETLMVPVPSLRDKLELRMSTCVGCELYLSGISLDGSNSDNLCVRAYKLLAKHVGGLPGVSLHLQKNIPAGAGLGGGSADAAFTLRGLNEWLDLRVPVNELHALAAQLGADVPFFLYDEPMLATGTGTDLRTFALDMPYKVRLVTPGIHSATAAAYKGLDLARIDPNRNLEQVLLQPIDTWRTDLVNDLERPVFALFPELADLKQQLYDEGAVYAAMSGSGSAVFGLFGK